METLIVENTLLDKGDRQTYKKLYPHLSDSDVNSLIKKRRKDVEEQSIFETELFIKKHTKLKESGIDPNSDESMKKEVDTSSSEEKEILKGSEKVKSTIDNKAKHAEDSSKQSGKNGDTRNKGE